MEPSIDALYASPAAEAEPPVIGEDPGKRARYRALAFLLASVAAMIVGLGAFAVVSMLGTFLLVVVGVLGLVGGIYSIRAIAKSKGSEAVGASAALLLGNIGMTFVGFLGALLSTMSFSRGRQLRRFGTILLPPVVKSEDWARDDIHVEESIEPALRDALAEQWRENGRTEHASVAAFARLTLDLISLGAPPQLIADAQRDALDEIRHAELCFALARSIDGRVESPGAFPQAAKARTLSGIRSLALAQLAVDSMIDGALHEGVSARIVARLRKRAAAPAIRSVLDEIARDEGRHARHGWDVLRWCVEQGGNPVIRALEGALRGLAREMKSPMPAEAEDGSWERFGLMGRAIEREEHALALGDLERRLHCLFQGNLASVAARHEPAAEHRTAAPAARSRRDHPGREVAAGR